MAEPFPRMIERLFDAFNRRDTSTIVELCDESMEFYAVTGEEVGRGAPYMGPKGLDEYLDDVASLWEELLVTPREVESRGNRMLVRGQVYARSRDLGIRDVPATWIWEVADGRFVRGEVYVDSASAEARFGRPGD
jgi:ketosteroid isomerase-like protein